VAFLKAGISDLTQLLGEYILKGKVEFVSECCKIGLDKESAVDLSLALESKWGVLRMV
jgi:hypothetical protein